MEVLIHREREGERTHVSSSHQPPRRSHSILYIYTLLGCLGGRRECYVMHLYQPYKVVNQVDIKDTHIRVVYISSERCIWKFPWDDKWIGIGGKNASETNIPIWIWMRAKHITHWGSSVWKSFPARYPAYLSSIVQVRIFVIKQQTASSSPLPLSCLCRGDLSGYKSNLVLILVLNLLNFCPDKMVLSLRSRDIGIDVVCYWVLSANNPVIPLIVIHWRKVRSVISICKKRWNGSRMNTLFNRVSCRIWWGRFVPPLTYQ